MADETEAIRIRLMFEAEQAKKEGKAMERQLLSLERRFDPLAAATLKYDRGLKLLEKSLEAGKIDAARYEKNLASLNREFDAAKLKANTTAVAVANVNKAVSGNTGFMARNRNVFQQAGYQVGDFAVQVQGGTSAITAFTQQGSQMLGVFGAYGAVAGAVLAVGAPIIATFLASGENAASYKDALKDLTEALDTYQEFAKNSLQTTDELAQSYGKNAELMRSSITLLRELALADVLESAQSAAASLAAEYENVFNIIDDANAGHFNLFEVGDVEMTREEVEKLRDALSDIGSATGPEEISSAVQAMNNLLMETYGRVEDIPPAFQDIAKRAAEADLLVGGLLNTIDETKVSVWEIVDAAYSAAKGFSAANGPVDTLYAKVTNLAAAAWSYAGAMGQAQLIQAREVGRGRGGDPTKMGGTAKDIQKHNLAAQLAYQPGGTAGIPLPKPKAQKKRAGSGGGRNNRKDVKPLFENAERELLNLERRIELIGKTKSEIAGLAAKHKLLDEAKKRGLDLDEKHAKTGKTLRAVIDGQAASIEKLTDEFERGKASQQQFENAVDSLADAFTGAIFEGESLRDSFKNILKGIAKDIVASGINKLLIGQFQAPKGGLLSGLFGGGSATAAPTGGGLLSGLFGGGGGKGGGLLSGLFGGGSAKGGGLLSGLFGGGGAAKGGGLLSGLMGGVKLIPGIGTALGIGAALFSGFKAKETILDEGVNVDISGGAAVASGYRDKEISRFWGLSKTNRTDEFVARGDVQESVAKRFNELKNSVLSSASILGVAGTALDAFSGKIKLSTQGMTEDQAIEALNSELDELRDELALTALGTDQLAIGNETASQTLDRLSEALNSVNPALDQLGLKLFDVSVAGAAAASNFAELFGGIDALNVAASNYYDAFYSDAEKLDRSSKAVRELMASLGLHGLPASLEEFRSSVEAFDLAGDKDAVARLLQIAPIFKDIADQGVSAAEAAQRLATELIDGVNPDNHSSNAAYQRALVGARAQGKEGVDAASTLNGNDDGGFAQSISLAVDRRAAQSEIARLAEAAKALGARPAPIGIADERINNRITSHMTLSDGTKLTSDAKGYEAAWFDLHDQAAAIINPRKSETAAFDARISELREQVRAKGGVPSFEGGGWTGNGSRVGGLDGKGGYLAMLHPREFVTDTTKNGGSVLEPTMKALLSEMQMLRSTTGLSVHHLSKIADGTDELVNLELEGQS